MYYTYNGHSSPTPSGCNNGCVVRQLPTIVDISPPTQKVCGAVVFINGVCVTRCSCDQLLDVQTDRFDDFDCSICISNFSCRQPAWHKQNYTEPQDTRQILPHPAFHTVSTKAGGRLGWGVEFVKEAINVHKYSTGDMRTSGGNVQKVISYISKRKVKTCDKYI